MSDAAVIGAGSLAGPKKLDDVMLAMDIVDTLRHRERVIDAELSVEEREKKLITRLREIYAAQGIDVPDRILRDGVKALEEERFVYAPPKNSFPVRLAKFYIARDRWLKPVAVMLGAALFISAAYEFGVEAPRAAKAERAAIELSETLPNDLAAARDEALALAETGNARTQIEALYQDGIAGARAGDAKAARRAVSNIALLSGDLSQDVTIRVVSRPGEFSGVFRNHDDDPSVKNYYLIVEAVTARGERTSLEITSEEDRARKRVESWGVRVPESVFNRIAADKRDDQIIQSAVIGQKQKGALIPEYSVEISGGAILEW